MERRSRWWVVLVVAVVISMVSTTVALAQKAPTQRQAGQVHAPRAAPGQVTPLAVGTFDGRVEPVDGTDGRTHLAYELRDQHHERRPDTRARTGA
jgi:hypothetical protein